MNHLSNWQKDSNNFMKTILTAILIILSTTLSAQKAHVLKLKNGSKYVGAMVRQDSNKVVFMGKDLNTYVFDTSEIQEYSKQSIERIPSLPMQFGYFSEASMQLLSMYNNRLHIQGIALNYSFGQVIKYRHSVSLDFNLYIHFGVLPTIGTTYRYQFSTKPNSPFVYANIGNYYEPGWSQSIGTRIGGGFGYQFGLSGMKRFVLKADFTRAAAKYYTSNAKKEIFVDKLINVGFGWRF